MAILPDDIKEIDQSDPAVRTLYNYIKYMKEQMEFWASRRELEIKNLDIRVTSLEQNE